MFGSLALFSKDATLYSTATSSKNNLMVQIGDRSLEQANHAAEIVLMMSCSPMITNVKYYFILIHT